jgi:cytochrome c biogenesis protein CcmG/thiol:disulfide interchange protein DsbE
MRKNLGFGRELFVCFAFMICAGIAVAEEHPAQPFLLSIGETFPMNDEASPDGRFLKPTGTLLHFVKGSDPDTEASLTALQSHLAGPLTENGFRIIAVLDGGTEEQSARLVKQLRLTFPLIADTRGIGFARVATGGFPRTLVVGHDHKIAYLDAGFDAQRHTQWLAESMRCAAAAPTPTPTATPSPTPSMRMELKEAAEPDDDVNTESKASATGVKIWGRATETIWANDIRGTYYPGASVTEWVTSRPRRTEGKYILYEFFGTWCPPCRTSFTRGKSFAEKYKDRLHVVAVSREPLSVVKRYVDSAQLDISIGVDDMARDFEGLQIQAIPMALIVNPDGIVIWQGNPLDLWAKQGILIDRMMKESSPQ